MIRFEIAILAITIVVLPQVGLAGGCGDGQCSVGAAEMEAMHLKEALKAISKISRS